MPTLAWEDLRMDLQALIDEIVAAGEPVLLSDEQQRPWAKVVPTAAGNPASPSDALTTAAEI